MNIYSSLKEASSNPEIRELALGFFDGLHLGHREVLSRSPGSTTAMLSFRDHPQSVLFRDQPVTLITGLPHKLKILQEWGLRNLILLPFNLEVSRKSPETFLAELREAFPFLESIRVGENFRFGYQRAGNPPLLLQWGAKEGIRIEVISSLLDQGHAVSSSRIRRLLSERNLEAAAALLGRPYSVYGRVVEGNRLGRQLGFPTINLATDDGRLLPLGVYHGSILLDRQSYQAAINIGTRPTVHNSGQVWVEAHLLKFSGNLYGQLLELEFQGFLRDEMRFESTALLRCQLEEDIRRIEAI